MNVRMYPHIVPLFLSDFNVISIFSTDFRKKFSNIKINENPFGVNRSFPCGKVDRQTHRRTDSHRDR